MTRRVGITEHPLQLLYSFLQEIGHSNPHVMQLEGMKEDLAPLFKFVTGKVTSELSNVDCVCNGII